MQPSRSVTENDQAAEQASDEGPEQRSHESDVRFREILIVAKWSDQRRLLPSTMTTTHPFVKFIVENFKISTFLRRTFLGHRVGPSAQTERWPIVFAYHLLPR
tara:strand:+ start:33591 stop:33899 length:309 start_codon:yes stop_codon:yes gene_type:complete